MDTGKKANLLMKAFSRDFENGGVFNRRILNMAYRRCRNRDEAEDAVQEFYSAIPLKIHHFDSPISRKESLDSSTRLVRYLARCFHNQLVDKYRKDMAYKKINLNPVQLDSGDSTVMIEDERMENPEQIFYRKERAKILREAVRGLEKKHRVVLRLAYFKGKGYDEIAEQLNIPVGTVKTRVYHGKRILEERLISLRPAA